MFAALVLALAILAAGVGLRAQEEEGPPTTLALMVAYTGLPSRDKPAFLQDLAQGLLSQVERATTRRLDPPSPRPVRPCVSCGE